MADKTKFKFGEKNRFKLGSFTRDTALASGNQAVGGVGFEPKAVFFLSCQDSAVGEMSLGVDSGVASKTIMDRHNSAPDTWDYTTTESIYNIHTGASVYKGEVDSFGVDGFTVAWTRVGTPTGTITVLYLAMR